MFLNSTLSVDFRNMKGERIVSIIMMILWSVCGDLARTVKELKDCREIYISSPQDYQGYYPPNSNITWEIVAAVSNCITNISITITKLELHNTSGECNDYIKIKEINPDSNIYDSCQHTRGPFIQARGNKIMVSFISDQDGEGKGVSMSVKLNCAQNRPLSDTGAMCTFSQSKPTTQIALKEVSEKISTSVRDVKDDTEAMDAISVQTTSTIITKDQKHSASGYSTSSSAEIMPSVRASTQVSTNVSDARDRAGVTVFIATCSVLGIGVLLFTLVMGCIIKRKGYRHQGNSTNTIPLRGPRTSLYASAVQYGDLSNENAIVECNVAPLQDYETTFINYSNSSNLPGNDIQETKGKESLSANVQPNHTLHVNVNCPDFQNSPETQVLKDEDVHENNPYMENENNPYMENALYDALHRPRSRVYDKAGAIYDIAISNETYCLK